MLNVKKEIQVRSLISIDEATNTIIQTNKELVFETLRNEINYFFNQETDKCIQNKVVEFISKNEKQILESVHENINQLQHTILNNISDKINNRDTISNIIYKKSFIQKLFS